MAAIAVPIFAQTTWGWCHTLGWGGFIWHVAAWTALAGLIGWLAVAVNRQPGGGQAAALATLDERLARGEVSPQEYRERRKALR
jgi:uncharacterized membrane protein